LSSQVAHFAAHFPSPKKGRYVRVPARTDETGVVSLPPAPPDPVPRIAAGFALGLATAFALRRHASRQK
jgi:hypothetical protein